MPRADDNKDHSIKVRCTPEQRKLIEKAAEKAERTLSDWIRRTIVKQAEAQLADDEQGKGKKR
ncbi:plasmid mobilization protein [Caulifigura coniformis]|nr:DUF1778 domain-containing protein [Caulifigura coniformis]